MHGTNSAAREKEMGTYDVNAEERALLRWTLASIKFWRRGLDGMSEGSFLRDVGVKDE